MAEQALVDQRLQRIEVGSRDLFGGLEGAAAREHRQSREEPLLRLAQEIVRPFDRRPQRLLSWIGVAAALKQVEPP